MSYPLYPGNTILALSTSASHKRVVTRNLPDMPCMLLHDKFEDIDEWSDYLKVIMSSDLIDICTIYNHRGRALAQSDESFELKNGEFQTLLGALNAPTNPKYESLEISGEAYKVFINDGSHGMLLKSGVRFATVCRTARVLVIGLHKVNVPTDEGSAAIMNLGDFLVTKGM